MTRYKQDLSFFLPHKQKNKLRRNQPNNVIISNFPFSEKLSPNPNYWRMSKFVPVFVRRFWVDRQTPNEVKQIQTKNLQKIKPFNIFFNIWLKKSVQTSSLPHSIFMVVKASLSRFLLIFFSWRMRFWA